MKASEAKQLAESYGDSVYVTNELNRIFTKIKAAASGGYRATTVPCLPYMVKSIVTAKLNDLGYKVEEFSDMREQTSWMQISW